MGVSLLDHRHEGLLRRAARLQEAGEVATLPRLRNFRRDPAGPSVPSTYTSTGRGIRSAEARAAASARPSLRPSSPRPPFRIRSAAKASISRTRSPSAFGAALEPVARSRLSLNQLDQRHSIIGHRRLRCRFQVSRPKPSRRSTMAASITPARALRYAGWLRAPPPTPSAEALPSLAASNADQVAGFRRCPISHKTDPATFAQRKHGISLDNWNARRAVKL